MSRHSEQRCAETSDDCKRMQEASQKVHGHQRISQRVNRIRSTIQKAGSRQHEIVVRLKRRATSRRWKSSKSQATTPLARVGVTERVTSQLVTSQTRATPGFGRVVLSSTIPGFIPSSSPPDTRLCRTTTPPYDALDDFSPSSPHTNPNPFPVQPSSPLVSSTRVSRSHTTS